MTGWKYADIACIVGFARATQAKAMNVCARNGFSKIAREINENKMTYVRNNLLSTCQILDPTIDQ